MKHLRLWLSAAALLFVTTQASAGLFTDDEAHKQIEELEARISKLEESYKQQTSSMLDLLSQVENLNQELRKMRGQNEELVHDLQDAEKRQKDFYVDLDTRLRRFETTAPAATPQSQAAAPAAAPQDAAGVAVAAPAKAADPQAEEKAAYDDAFALYKAANYEKALVAFRDFVKQYPESTRAPYVYYLMGNAYFALEDFKRSIASYQVVVSKYESNSKVPDAWLNIAGCQQKLEDIPAARKTLKQLIAKYPASQAAAKAKKRLAALK